MSPPPPTSKELSELSDEQLLQQYQQGRTEVFEVLINRYRRELLNFLIRLLGNRAAAEDVFQDTFLQIHLSAGSFDPKRRFKPWLFTIAANKGRDHLRKRKRRPAAPLDAPVGDEGQEESQSFIDLLKADLPQPEQRLEQAELEERVDRTIQQLPEHLREILLLAYFQKFSYNQIAEILQIPLGTVKSRLHTAVGTFAKLWREQNQELDTS
jgi:RNA polymerase sigma-70 factor (ECF subfamily)